MLVLVSWLCATSFSVEHFGMERRTKRRVPKNPSWSHYQVQSGRNNNLYKTFIVIIAGVLVVDILACCVFFNRGVTG